MRRGDQSISLLGEPSAARSQQMPPAMEDYRVILDAPQPRTALPFRPYDVSLAAERIARMLPIHGGRGVSQGLVDYLTHEMNEEAGRESLNY